MPTTPRAKPVALRIELLDIEPLIWRRILVPDQWTMVSLHNYLQWVLGWKDTHAHEFRLGTLILAPDWWIAESAGFEDTAHYRDERRFSVAAVIKEIGHQGEFEYHYDMGDGWRHRIILEIPPTHWTDYDLPLPRCIAGENACPPDDVGGPHGYHEFLKIISEKGNEQHGDLCRWIGGVFDPKGFDLNRLNRDWRGAKARRS